MPKEMKVFFDSEFLEDSKTIDLISMGFVREDGKELYFVLNSFDTLAVARHGWLMANVMPSIGHEEITNYVTGMGTPVKDLVLTDENLVSRTEARQLVLDYVADIWPEFWAWYGAYDHVALASLFGRMIDLPKRIPMMTHDLKTLHKRAGKPDMPKQPRGLHNALDDARFNVVRYEFLMKLLTPKTYIVADSEQQAQAATRGIKDPIIWTSVDQMRGPQLSKDDKVIVLTSDKEKLLQLEMIRRKP